MASTPSAIIADAITSLTHATTLALATVEDQARLDVARAASETRQARNQRDEALNGLRAAEMGQSTHKQQLEGWKTAVEKGDLTIKHQTETISQLRDETSQWKEQYAQLEKTCQQWKDQFLRVEQERYRLSARLEELIADQLSHANHSSQQYYQPHRTKAERDLAPFSTASSSTKRGSTISEQQVGSKRKAMEDDDEVTRDPPQIKPQKPLRNLPKTKNPPAASAVTKPTKKPAGARSAHEKVSMKQQQKQSTGSVVREPVQEESVSASHRPQTQVIRRVQAVIEVPVKTEEDDEDDPEYDDFEPEQEEQPRAVKKPRTTKTITVPKKKPTALARVKDADREKSKSWQVWRDEEYRTPRNGHANDEEDDNDEEEDDNEDDIDFYQPAQRRRNPQRRKSAKDLREAWGEEDEDEQDEEDEEEDELIMGAEDNQEVYGTRAFPPEKLKTKSTKSSATAQKLSTTSKKRKIAPSQADGGGSAKAATKASKKK